MTGQALMFQLRVGHDQFALHDAFQPAELGGEFLQPRRPAAQDDHFQAQIMCQMGVHGGYHQVGVLVLQGGQMPPQLRPVVIVNQGQRAGGVTIVRLPGLGGQPFAEQLPDGFAAGGKLFFAAIMVKLSQQVFFQRHRKTDDGSHGFY
jgi:hypothetical protein